MITQILSDVNVLKKLITLQPKTLRIIVSPEWKYPLFKKLQKALEKTRDFKEIMNQIRDKEHKEETAKIVQKMNYII